MKKRLLLLMTTALLPLALLFGNGTNPLPPGGPDCNSALFLPNGLNGLTGTLPAINNQQPFPGCPSSVISNPDWYSFVAESNGMTITVTPSNCNGVNGSFGMQAAVYGSCGGDVVVTHCACSESPFDLSSGSFVVGNTYYLVLDGCASDVCDYAISVVEFDPPPGITLIDESNVNLVEGLVTDSYCVVLNSPPSDIVTINISPDAQTAVFTSPLVFTPANWNVVQCLTVEAVDDAVVEGLHTSTISHSAVSSDPDYNGLAMPDITAFIADNDEIGSTCSTALFQPNGLNGLTGTLPATNIPQDFPGCPGSALSNPDWYSFVAGSNGMTIT